MARDLRSAKLNAGCVREHRFHPERRWRFDFAWPDIMLAVEVEGITHGDGGGRHQRGTGYMEDCDKYNAAMFLGWRLLRYTGEHLKSGVHLIQISRAINDV